VAAKKAGGKAKRAAMLERELDEGLEETFPGSDVVAVTEPGPRERGAAKKKPAKKKRH
jgi:hypothetical protein